MSKIKNPEILRYRNNKMAFNLCMLAIALQCVAFIYLYRSLQWTPQFNTGLDIIINIVFLLVVFLASEKVKTYHVKWGIALIIIGAINSLRLLTYVFPTFVGEQGIIIEQGNFITGVVSYILVEVALTISGIVTIIRGNILNNFLKTLSKEGN